MQTLIIYDNQGKIFSNIKEGYLIPQGGVQFLEVEVPLKKRVVSVDVSVTPHVAILEDIPKTELEILQAAQLLQSNRLSEKEIDDLEFQNFVIETLGGM